MKVSQFTLSALFAMSCSYSTTAFAPASRGVSSVGMGGLSANTFGANDIQPRVQLSATTTSEEIIPREVLFGNPTYACKFRDRTDI